MADPLKQDDKPQTENIDEIANRGSIKTLFFFQQSWFFKTFQLGPNLGPADKSEIIFVPTSLFHRT